MSERSADGGGGKKVFWNSFAFSLFVVAISLRVGMKVGKGVDSIYFLTFHILCPSAVMTNSRQCSAFALLILL